MDTDASKLVACSRGNALQYDDPVGFIIVDYTHLGMIGQVRGVPQCGVRTPRAGHCPWAEVTAATLDAFKSKSYEN